VGVIAELRPKVVTTGNKNGEREFQEGTQLTSMLGGLKAWFFIITQRFSVAGTQINFRELDFILITEESLKGFKLGRVLIGLNFTKIVLAEAWKMNWV
jgi:hypothetical protein